MIFTLSQTPLSRTMIINPEGQFVYKINSTNDGGKTSVHRANACSSAGSSRETITSDTASEVTLVDSKWSELARICWGNSQLTRVCVQLSGSCLSGEVFKRCGLFLGVQKLKSHNSNSVTSSQFTFNDSKGRCFRWNLGSLGFGLPVVSRI